MTPAERLLKAAELLEGRASEALEGPWREMQMGSEGSKVLAGGNTVSTARHVALARDDATARYIATMHPRVGLALAAWLRASAKWDGALTVSDAAQALADLLLAGEQ